MKQYEFHPLAGVFPLMPLSQRSELLDDIKKHGQLEPIGLFEHKILDGRNRYLACRQGGIEARFITLEPHDAKEFIMSKNYHRRHLTREDMKTIMMRMVAQQESLHVTNNEIARASGVSVSTVKREKRKRVKRGGLTHPAATDAPEKDVVLDDAGFPVPEPAMEYWSRKPEAIQILNQMRACKGLVKKLVSEDLMWREVNLGGVLGDLESAINRFRGGVPAHVCAHCQGQHPARCTACKGRGCVSEYFWRQCVPDKLREMREKSK